ncbi:MAG: hypothetical protein HC845_00495 [Akkermansiaceae bacterium]|nr:hypothetical protein [Akkermansiaceae bacterium]
MELHLEFQYEGIRVRTDFSTRPPRLTPQHLESLWLSSADLPIPFTGLKELLLMKLTMREKDYPIVGELARRLKNVDERLLFSRSARDLLQIAKDNPHAVDQLIASRPLLSRIKDGEDAVAAALDAERRSFMKADEARLATYQKAAQPWESAWPALAPKISNLSLSQAHAVICDAAFPLLPTTL